MKHVRALLLIILILSIACFAIQIPTTAQTTTQSTEILEPDFVITGEFDQEHLSAYYGMSIEEYGVYRVTLNSIGNTMIELEINQFEGGYPYYVSQFVSNETSTFLVTHGAQNLGPIYQLHLSLNGYEPVEQVEYTLSIERVAPLAIQDNFENTLTLQNYNACHYTLTVNEEYNAYEIIASTSRSCYFYFYDAYGINIRTVQISSYTTEYFILLSPGEYDLFIELSSYYLTELVFQMIPKSVPMLSPDSSLDLVFNATSIIQYVELSLEPGTKYDLNLIPYNDENVGFYIDPFCVSGQYVYNINNWGPGGAENISELSVWSTCIAFNGWDYNFENEYTQSYFHFEDFYYYYYYYYYPVNSMDYVTVLLTIYSFSEGGATIQVNKGVEPLQLSLDTPVTCSLNEDKGSFYSVYRLDNLPSGHLYEFTFDHTPEDTFALLPRCRIYGSNLLDQDYLFSTRPLLTPSEREKWDSLSSQYSTLYYSTAELKKEVSYYHPINADQFLIVMIPDNIHEGSLYSDYFNKGTIQISVDEILSSPLTLEQTISVDPSPFNSAMFTAQLEKDYVYEIEVSSTNLQSYGSVSLWNTTGHQLARAQSSMYRTDRFSSLYYADVETSGKYFLVVSIEGDTPVTVTVKKLSSEKTTGTIQLPFFVGGLIAAAAEGILIGVVIGKLKFGKEAPG